MSIVYVILVLIIVGFFVAILNHPKIGIDPFFKWIINGLVAIFVLIWLLQVFGILKGNYIHV